MKGFKGFKKDMTCQGHRFSEGETYKHEGPIELCKSGFHFCELPQDVFGYYAPGESIFHEVEAEGVDPKTDNDSKRVASELRIGARIDIPAICKIAVQAFFTRFGFADKVKAATANQAGDNGAANAGDCGAANAGDCGAASVGEHGIAIVSTDGKVRGKLGALLILTQRDDSGKIKTYAVKMVDGRIIKPDTWYKLKAGKFVKIKSEA